MCYKNQIAVLLTKFKDKFQQDRGSEGNNLKAIQNSRSFTTNNLVLGLNVNFVETCLENHRAVNSTNF